MPRLIAAGLDEALERGNLATHGTLRLLVPTATEIRSYHFATAILNFNGVEWRPELRESGEVNMSLTGDADEATVEVQNVDNLFGIEAISLEEYLSGSLAVVGRYFQDLDHGARWHDETLTGLITGIRPNERAVQLLVVPDSYSSVSVGPFRYITRACQAGYKTAECGRPITDPFDFCDYTLNGANGCHGRWGATEKFIHIMGFPYIDNKIFQKII
jgi:hypothetical protein